MISLTFDASSHSEPDTFLFSQDNMEDEGISMPDSPMLDSGIVSPGQSVFEKEKAALQTYLDSIPYECESMEEMQTKLDFIVGKISICVETKNWLVLTTWDGMLQWFVRSRVYIVV